MRDYYTILGISRNATNTEIKAAYRKLALKFHPDKNPGDKFFDQMFRDLKDAYETLSDESRRAAYDENFKHSNQSSYKSTYKQTSEPEPSQNDIILNIIANLKKINKETNGVSSSQINSKVILEYLSKILTDNMIAFYSFVSDQTKKELIFLIIPLLRFINEIERNKFITQIVKLAGSDNDLIYQIDKNLKSEISSQRMANTADFLIRNWKLVGFIFLLAIFFLMSENDNVNSNKTSQARNIVIDEEPELKKSTSKWKNNQLSTGESPYNNYFGEGIYDRNYQNKVKIHNGQNTDAIVCLTEYYSPNRTIRNEYIRAGESFEMTSIPDGTYYLKSFFGNYWNPDTIIMGQITGFFDTLAGFTKSDKFDDLLHIEQTNSEYSIYEITLYPVSGGNMESQQIKATEFFK